jgi:iron(III) transport system substrate-binding protein
VTASEQKKNPAQRFFPICRLSSLVFAFIVSQHFMGETAIGMDEAKPEWQAAWEKTLEAANREGQIFIYGTDTVEILFREFQKKYPQIKVTTMSLGAPAALQRILAERRAGKYVTDLFITGAHSLYQLYQAKALDPIAPFFILPEVLDQSRWWRGKHYYSDPEGKYIFAFEGITRGIISFNTGLVGPHEIKSYWDLLSPTWKGKIVVLDPTSGGRVAESLRFIYYNPELGPEYLRRLLGEMDVTVSRDTRQMMDWLAQGKFAIAMLVAAAVLRADQAKAQSLPVDWFGPKHFKEGDLLSVGPGNVVVLNRAPHPNATKVAINWLLSRDGQLGYQTIHDPGHDSLRVDISKDDVPLSVRRVEGGKYLFAERPEWMDMTPINNLINEVWTKGKLK